SGNATGSFNLTYLDDTFPFTIKTANNGNSATITVADGVNIQSDSFSYSPDGNTWYSAGASNLIDFSIKGFSKTGGAYPVSIKAQVWEYVDTRIDLVALTKDGDPQYKEIAVHKEYKDGDIEILDRRIDLYPVYEKPATAIYTYKVDTYEVEQAYIDGYETDYAVKLVPEVTVDPTITTYDKAQEFDLCIEGYDDPVAYATCTITQNEDQEWTLLTVKFKLNNSFETAPSSIYCDLTLDPDNPQFSDPVGDNLTVTFDNYVLGSPVYVDVQFIFPES
ncbi:MAG: hypothetical protein FWF22_04815, partial [Treponema sp.]|nr:hypothetical protein [Treponema sp.]